MLEIPEAHVIAAQINATIAGKKVTDVTVGHDPHAFAWYNRPPAEYQALLAGSIVQKAVPYGGMIEIAAQASRLLTSLSPRYFAAGEKRPAKHQLLVEFADSSALTATVHMWGEVLCYREDERPESRHAASIEKPSPLSEGFGEAYFESLLASLPAGPLSAKAFLATEQRIPGLGNGVLQDILWTARIHPKRKLATLSSGELAALFGAVKSVLADMAAKGGRDTERDLFGSPGGYQTVLSKNTVGKPCPACGAIIQKEAYLGGAIYYCGSCQKA
jgi:formamidopyrimidine-DNA glycosylase